MITVGEIKRVYTDINNTVICDVDISVFKTTINKFNESDELIGSVYTATICTPPGLYMPYDAGDIVYIGFVNNKISTPVILGLVHKNLPAPGDSSSFAYFKDLKVTNNVTLPQNTTIGDIDFQNLRSTMLDIDNIYTMLKNMSRKVETFTVSASDWIADSTIAPFTYKKSITLTTFIDNKAIVELINTDAINFAIYNFSVGSVNGQIVTIYSIGVPNIDVTFKISIS